METNDDYIRRRAEIMGLALSDSDVETVRAKWESSPLCNVDELLIGIRSLRETASRVRISVAEKEDNVDK